MTVNNTASRDIEVAAVSQTVFTYDFKIFKDSDLVVEVDGVLQVLNTDYTVTGADNAGGGTFVFVTPMAGGEIVVWWRDVPYTQDVALQDQKAWPSKVFNDEFDKLTMLIQQLLDGVNRSLKYDESFAGLNPILPNPESGKYLVGDGTNWQLATNVIADPGFLQIGTGAVLRTANAKMAEVYSVTDFGAVGDGSTDDTAAVQACFDAIPTTGDGKGRGVFFPKGIYKLTSQITFNTDTSIHVFGEGVGISTLRFATATGGLDFNQTTVLNKVNISDLSLETSNAGGGTAIGVTYPAWASYTLPTVNIQNVEIRPDTDFATNYWTKGIVLDGCWNAIVRNIAIRGKNTYNPGMTTGVELIGESLDVVLESVYAYFMTNGIVIGGVTEGTKISNCTILAVVNGIDASTAAGKPGLNIYGTHVNADQRCIKLSKRQQFTIQGNLFYKRATSTSNFTAIEILDECIQGTITGNIIIVNNATGTDIGIDVQGSNSRHHIIQGNYGDTCDTWIKLGAGVHRCLVFGNNGNNNTVNYSDLGDNNRVFDNEPVDAAFKSFADADTTPSVKGNQTKYFKTANTGATSVTDFDDGLLNQVVHIVAGDVNTTIFHNASVISLQGGVNFAMGNGAILTLWKDAAGTWKEIARRTA